MQFSMEGSWSVGKRLLGCDDEKQRNVCACNLVHTKLQTRSRLQVLRVVASEAWSDSYLMESISNMAIKVFFFVSYGLIFCENCLTIRVGYTTHLVL
jgi:hypothetical protein